MVGLCDQLSTPNSNPSSSQFSLPLLFTGIICLYPFLVTVPLNRAYQRSVFPLPLTPSKTYSSLLGDANYKSFDLA